MDKLVNYVPASFQSFPAYLEHHIHHARNPWSFVEYYQNAPDSIHTIMPLFWTSMTLTYVLGLITGNVSQIGEFRSQDVSGGDEISILTSFLYVSSSTPLISSDRTDRQWTFLPIAYSLHFVLYPLFNTHGDVFMHNLPRLFLMWGLMVRSRRVCLAIAAHDGLIRSTLTCPLGRLGSPSDRAYCQKGIVQLVRTDEISFRYPPGSPD